MKTTPQQPNIKESITFKMVNEEARELSTKLCNRMYVCLKNRTLYVSMVKEGKVLSGWDFGNKII
jgi:hypothetical protein